jgi:hypothetical protein
MKHHPIDEFDNAASRAPGEWLSVGMIISDSASTSPTSSFEKNGTVRLAFELRCWMHVGMRLRLARSGRSVSDDYQGRAPIHAHSSPLFKPFTIWSEARADSAPMVNVGPYPPDVTKHAPSTTYKFFAS